MLITVLRLLFSPFFTGDDKYQQVLLSFIYGGVSALFGLFISDYSLNLSSKGLRALTGNTNGEPAVNTGSINTDINIDYAAAGYPLASIHPHFEGVMDHNNNNIGETFYNISITTGINAQYPNPPLIKDIRQMDGIHTTNDTQHHHHHEHSIHDRQSHHHHSHHSHHHNTVHSMKSYQQNMLEGGILFATFEVVAYVLEIIVPEQFNLKFSFNQFLQLVERDLDPSIPVD